MPVQANQPSQDVHSCIHFSELMLRKVLDCNAYLKIAKLCPGRGYLHFSSFSNTTK